MVKNEKPILKVSDLSIHFKLDQGVIRAVNGVTFELATGGTLGVIGESGSGKSVLAHSLLGLVPMPPGRAVAGQILLGGDGVHSKGVDLLRLHPDSKQWSGIRGRELAIIFQEPMAAFSPIYSVGSQITEAILLHQALSKKTARRRAVELLERVGIPQPQRSVDSYPHQLSGGMLQRAMIAMALSCNPRVLIADEPTTALDVTVQAQILCLLRDIQEEYGMAMIFISHDMAVVGELADEIMVMYLGSVMEYGFTDQVFDHPAHPYTRALWRAVPSLSENDQVLHPIKGAVPAAFETQPGCPFFGRCEERIPGVCDAALPELVEIGPEHRVRCVLAERGNFPKEEVFAE